MKYVKRLKTRMYAGIVFAALGLSLIGSTFFGTGENASVFGTIFFVAGLARALKSGRILKNQDRLRLTEIYETDERNVMLWMRARGMAFTVYILLAAAAVIVLHVLDMHEGVEPYMPYIC